MLSSLKIPPSSAPYNMTVNFYHIFSKKLEIFNFTVLHRVFAKNQENAILPYNIQFYCIPLIKTKGVPLGFFQKLRIFNNLKTEYVNFYFFMLIAPERVAELIFIKFKHIT